MIELAKIVEELDFDKAFRHVKYDARFDFIQFPIELRVFEHFFDENIKSLKESILQGNYVPKRLRKIWVPKKNFFLRPGAIPHLRDRVLFQALVDKIAEKLEQELPPLEENVVFSSRLRGNIQSGSMFRHPKGLWLAFKTQAIEYCDEQDVNFVLVSDLASYFENIDLRLLTDTLTSSGVSPNYAEAIRQILVVWANGRTRGLPQMMAPCSLLANMYLSQVDKYMVLRGYRYIRYVDDIRIFVHSHVEARKALLILTERLKDCYLDVQASKTQIVTAPSHKQELASLETHLAQIGVSAVGNVSSDYDDDFGPDLEIPEPKLVSFLADLIENPNYDDRHLRYCINRLGDIKSPAAHDLVLSKLSSMPQETATFVKYLLKLDSSNITDKTFEAIISFLDSEQNIYDWQTMWLLIFLVHQTIKPKHLNSLFRNDKLNKHPINRAILCYLLSSKGNLTIRRDMIYQYSQEESVEVKMAILCGTFDLEKKERNRFYSIAGTDRILSQLIDILKNRKLAFV